MAVVIGASDRTHEFRICAKSYQQRMLFSRSTRDNRIQSQDRSCAGRLTMEFLTQARSLAKDLHLSQMKFRKLCLHLTEATPASNISNLVEVIQLDIIELNQGVKALRQSEGGLQFELISYSQALKHNRLITSGIEYRLAELVNAFQKTLETHRELISRFTQPGATPNGTIIPTSVVEPSHSLSNSRPSNSPSMSATLRSNRKEDSSIAIVPTSYNTHENPVYTGLPYGAWADSCGPAHSPPYYATELRSEQIQLPRVDQEIRQRDATLKRVESTIVQLGEIYQQFSTIVQEQQDIVTRIDSHTEEFDLNIDSAHGYILTYFKSVSSRRAFMIKAFVAIFFCFVLFAWFSR